MKKKLLLFAGLALAHFSFAQEYIYESVPARLSEVRTSNLTQNDLRMPATYGYFQETASTKSTSAAPIAAYIHPKGFFFVGLSANNNRLVSNIMVGYPGAAAKWRNNSANAVSYSWIMPNSDGNGTYEALEKDPIATYPDLLPSPKYVYPTLTAKSTDNQTSTFKYQNGEFRIGGRIMDANKNLFGLTNCDVSKGYTSYLYKTNESDGYLFGTRSDKTCDAVVSVFDKPATKYMVDSVWISLGRFAAPAGNEFKLLFCTLDENNSKLEPLDTFAIATCKTENVKQFGTNYLMMFKSFMVKNKISKQFEPATKLEISDFMMVEMNGFNKDGITLSVHSQVVNTTFLNSAYFYRIDGVNRYLSYLTQSTTALLFNFGAYYPGKATGIGETTVEASLFSAINKGEEFEVTYPEGYNSVSIYNIAGQQVAHHKLTNTGKENIPSQLWNKGIYLFKFEGKTAYSIKALK